jgi:hypothetical protein
MPEYPRLASLLGTINPAVSERAFESDILPYLQQIWLDDYTSTASDSDIIQVSPDNFSYLFDVAAGRLIAAWGISRGEHKGDRPSSRMKKHPKGAGVLYHRGHAIPHTLGGGTDINLVAQLGSVNIGPFRPLEIEAVATPGAFYFTYWMYAAGKSQKPKAVEQGLLIAGRPPDIRRHKN